MRFQLADLLRDGALGHAQLLGREAEVQVTRGSFEGAEAVQWGEGGCHSIDFLPKHFREDGSQAGPGSSSLTRKLRSCGWPPCGWRAG